MTSILLVLVVFIMLGVSVFAVFGGFTSGSGFRRSCLPATAPLCSSGTTHDVQLLVPFKAAQTRSPIPFTASLPAGESATSFTFNFGDGSTATGPGSTVTHSYVSPGTYLISVHAIVGKTTHDNNPALALVQVNAATATSNPGTFVPVRGLIVANTTATIGTTGVTAVIGAGGSVTFSANYEGSPTNSSWTTAPPTIVTPNGTRVTSNSNSASSATATVVFPNPGIFLVNFSGHVVENATRTNVSLPFIWTVFVTPTPFSAAVAGATVPRSPHPGTILNYELAPGGGLSEDPAIDYETVGAEPIFNVYQTLITYNGSTVGATPDAFVPVLATCVPGSAACVKLYGQSLQKGWNYTFVVTSNAAFYDPATQKSWGVYPTDVLFSIARTLGFSDLPCYQCNPGWIIGQSLLNTGNYTWDTYHVPLNNTPQNVYAAISVNDTASGACPPAALLNDHGCVTFHAYGGNRAWPYFLELIADPLGGAIVSCGWFSAQAEASGVPYWTSGNVSGTGDRPCGMPGTTGWGIAPSLVPFTGWDRWQYLGSGASGTYLGHVQYAMLGSGPYYLAQYQIGASYELSANPAYQQNPHCTWSGCEPAPKTYAQNVIVTWEQTPTVGETAYASGVADHASIPATDLPLLLQLIQEGKVQAISAPTLTIGFYPLAAEFSVGGAQRFVTTPVSVPSDWFSYIGMRQFFVHSYPYSTIAKTYLTQDGIQLGFDYGGAIPKFMANYYPTDIAWPSGDPCADTSNFACAGFWWNTMHQSTSPYYDPQVLACQPSNPCEMPLFGTTGSPTRDQEDALWAAEISSLTGGAIKVTPTDINFVTLIINSQFSLPGQNPMPFYSLGWAPDYPDPTDYVGPLFGSNSTYTYGDAIWQGLVGTKPVIGCPQPFTNYGFYANLTSPVTQACQGVAYRAMLKALADAGKTADGNARVLLYDEAEKIANQLALYVYTAQANEVATAAAWINVSSLNTNVTIGGGGDDTFFWTTGNGLVS